jgi:hypothetical protein
MSTKNPFGNLAIRRDEDDEEVQVVKAPATTSTQGGLFNTQNQEKKKKKVRPEEKKKQEEAAKDDEEGFEVVGKKKVFKPKVQAEEENVDGKKQEKQKRFHKGPSHQAIKENKFNTEKRTFDKHSGTGFGKEIKKGGAGGKHTWEGKRDDYNPREDSLFDYALNPESRPKRTFEKREEVAKPEEKAEETPVEEKKEEVAEEKKEEFNDKRKKGKKVDEEVKKEDLLEIPENALSLSEYQEQLKQKNAALNDNKPKIEVKHANPDLKTAEINENEFVISIAGGKVKKEKKVKDKKTKEKELTFELKTEGGALKDKFGKKNHPEAKFRFKDDDFPEL